MSFCVVPNIVYSPRNEHNVNAPKSTKTMSTIANHAGMVPNVEKQFD